VKPSTVAFLQEGRKTPDFSFFDFLHGYLYTRWPYLYIGLGTGEHRLARVLQPCGQFVLKLFSDYQAARQGEGPVTFADTYHGKVLPLEEASRLVTLDEPVAARDLEQVVPYGRAREIVLRNPDHIVLLDCPCRLVREHPCEPVDVCIIIGEPFAGFVAEHHPHRSRWITQEEAAEILRAEHTRGHVHHAFFKDAMLGRFYAICNCCACCCGAMQAFRNGVPMLASSGYVSRMHTTRCEGCGECVAACQFRAITMVEGKAVVDETQCMGCGVCVSKCEKKAHSLERDPRRGAPLEVRELVSSTRRTGSSPAQGIR
jgi:ferredoxin